MNFQPPEIEFDSRDDDQLMQDAEGVGVAIEGDGYAAPLNYQAEAQQTKSDQFHGNLVAISIYAIYLREAIEALQNLDKLKKTLFYGKINECYKPGPKTESCEKINFAFPDPISAIDIIHAIIGKATEAGELLELLEIVTIGGEQFDPINFKEEIGDGMWYDAIGLEAVDGTIAETQNTNIAKLRARFPNKFTEYDANNRNLSAERKILES